MTARLALLALSLALGAQAAGACEPLEPPVSACAAVRVEAGHACLDDPSAPGGFRIMARSTMDPSLPDCGAEGCVRPLPAEAPGAPFWRLLTVLAGS